MSIGSFAVIIDISVFESWLFLLLHGNSKIRNTRISKLEQKAGRREPEVDLQFTHEDTGSYFINSGFSAGECVDNKVPAFCSLQNLALYQYK